MLVLAGHPLDTIKVRMQAGEYPTMSSAFRGVCSGRAMVFDPATRTMVVDPSSPVLSVRQRVASLYRGASLLLVLQGFYSATLFGLNGIVRTLLTPYFPDAKSPNSQSGNAPQLQQQPLARVLAAAIVTAPIHTALMTPMDVVKVRLQALHKDGAYGGPIDCVRRMLRGEGAPTPTGVGAAAATTSAAGKGGAVRLARIKGLFAGYGAYAAVRTVGFGPYFVTFEAVKNALTCTGSSADGSKGPLFHHDNPLVPIIGGSCAGVAYWIAAFPLDTIKTTLQLSRSPLWDGHSRRAGAVGGVALPRMGYAEALRFILTDGNRRAKYSPRLLYRGFSVAMVRAMPTNAAMFWGFTETEKCLIRNGW